MSQARETTPSTLLDPMQGEGGFAFEDLRDDLVDPLAEHAMDAVQMSGGEEASSVKRVAAQGLQGSAGSLPYLDKIQSSFGPHDVSGVKAYTGEEAAAATARLGATAYASGDKVAFSPGGLDLHIAAHEAAHIVQQRAGLKPLGGVGSPGDPLEQHADAVAEQVVQGKSARPLLDDVASKV